MAKTGTKELTRLLRAKGVRKKLAKKIGKLEGNRQRAGGQGEDRARRAVKDLESAAQEIRKRVLASDPRRRESARKAAQTRKRNAAKRRTSAKRAASTRSKVARARSSSRK